MQSYAYSITVSVVREFPKLTFEALTYERVPSIFINNKHGRVVDTSAR